MRSLLAFAIAMAASAATAERVAGQGAVKSVYDDWQLRCDTLPGAQHEQCALMQSVLTEDRPDVGISVIVLKTADQKSRLMRVIAPMGAQGRQDLPRAPSGSLPWRDTKRLRLRGEC